MHTFERAGVCIHHNSDLSGDVSITKEGNDNLIEIVIPGIVLLEFVAMVVRNDKIAELEGAPWQKILGVSP